MEEMKSAVQRSIRHFLLIILILTPAVFTRATEIKTVGARFGIATAHEDHKSFLSLSSLFKRWQLISSGSIR